MGRSWRSLCFAPVGPTEFRSTIRFRSTAQADGAEIRRGAVSEFGPLGVGSFPPAFLSALLRLVFLPPRPAPQLLLRPAGAEPLLRLVSIPPPPLPPPLPPPVLPLLPVALRSPWRAVPDL